MKGLKLKLFRTSVKEDFNVDQGESLGGCGLVSNSVGGCCCF